MQLGLSESLSSLVARRFVTARDAGHLIFSPTHLSIIYSSGIPFQLRYCPALAGKPTGAPKPDGTQASKPDPFEDPSPDLLLTQFPQDNPAYTLVLNKFPVIPNHFILATKAFKSQTDVLEKEDLEAVYACVKAWGESDGNGGPSNGRKRLFAFFNSGDESGASQPHRHLQFLPVESMRNDDCGSWEPLLDRCSEAQGVGSFGCRQLSQLPFVHFAAPIPPNPSAEMLHAMYLSLYREAVKAAKGYKEGSNRDSATGDDTGPSQGPAAISYNLGLTESTMIICPRRNDSAQIPVSAVDNGNIDDLGIVALNGTILAGTLMVKAEAEWDELRNNQESLTNVLATIGYPRSD